MNIIIAQILGFVSLIFFCISYYFKEKSKFLIFQLIANSFYGVAFLVVGSYVGGIITLISIFRCLIIFFSEKYNWNNVNFVIPIFVILYSLSTIIFWNSYLDIIPLITSITFTVCFTLKNMQLMRIILIFPNVLLILYNILCFTYVSAILDLIEVIILIVAIIKFKNNEKEDNKV